MLPKNAISFAMSCCLQFITIAWMPDHAAKPICKRVPNTLENDVVKTRHQNKIVERRTKEKQNWKGNWIKDSHDKDFRIAPYFRKTLVVNKKMRLAKISIAVAGLYELYINGQRTGTHLLDPMFTRFDRRNLYATYDVTKELQKGNNTIGVLLGYGWYNLQSTAVWYFDKAPWRARPSFCMDLSITYSDGTTETIATDQSWKTALSPVVFNSIYTGEHYDARKEIPHWNETGLDDSKWVNVIITGAPSQNIAEQNVPPIRAVEEISPVAVNKINDTDYVFNIGRNIAGVCRIKLKNRAGTIVKLKHGEHLYPNGHVDISNIDIHYRPTDNTDPFGTDLYHLKDDGSEETFQPRFTYHGFQYVEVTSNKPITLTRENLTGIFIHSDVAPAGSISCSDTIINRLWQATNNSYLSNLMGYPTDCPQREKNGWTADAHLAIETGLYNFDSKLVYEKWLADMRDEQQPNGMLPAIIPSSGWGYEHYNTVDWLSALIIIPWELYRFYGDSQALKNNYPNMKRYIDHLDETHPDGLIPEGLGDREAIRSHANIELTSTAYYYNDALILSKTSKLFHKSKDEKKYNVLARKIKAAFNRKFYHAATQNYGNGYQTENSVALYWGLVAENNKSAVAANLAKSVSQDSLHLDIGVLGSKTILNALTENSYADLAYQLATKDSYPSWGYWMKQGMTTLPENWDMQSSLNHIFFGEISAWFYRGLGGMNIDENKPGFKHILLQPHIVMGLNNFHARHRSRYGNIASGWKTTENFIVYTTTIPSNTMADLRIDLYGKIVKTIQVGPGKHSWKFKLRATEKTVSTRLSYYPEVMLTSKDAVVCIGQHH